MFSRELGVCALALSLAMGTSCVVQGGVSDPQPGANGDQMPALLGGTPSGTDFRVIVDALTPNVWAGTRLNFKVRVENIGPDPGFGNVEIELDPNLDLEVWTCVSLEADACPAPSGTDPAGLASLGVELGSNGWAEFVVDSWVASSAVDPVTVTARVSAEDDFDPNNNEDTATKEIMQSVLLKVTKSDGQASAAGGSTLVYEVLVENWGPSDAPAVSVTDDVSTLPFTSVEWDCTGLDGAECGTEGGTGNVADVGFIPFAGALLYTVSGHLDPCFTGVVTNEAHATADNLDTDESVLSATDSTNVPEVGDTCESECECDCDDGHHDNGHNGAGHHEDGNGHGHNSHDDDGDGDDDHKGNGHHHCECECDDDDQGDE